MTILRALIPAMPICVIPSPGTAHPPTSAVMDSRRNVYYRDLENVWMILPDGTTGIFE